MTTHQSRNPAYAAILLLGTGLSLSGCATLPDDLFEDLGSNITVPPPPPPPPPAQASVGPVERPTLGNSPAPPVDPSEKARIADSDQDETLTLRLVQSARSINVTSSPMSTAADPDTDAGSATLVFEIPADPDADVTARFTLGNPALGISNVELSPDPSGTVLMANLPDGRRIQVQLATLDRGTTSGGRDFEWTGYGGWSIRSASDVPTKGSPIVTGYETPDAAMPTSGSATFTGFVQGSVAVEDGTEIRTASLLGDASITADFAAGTLSGQAPNIMAIPFGVYPNTTPGTPQPWNGLTFAGSFTTGLNGFTGTTGVSNAPGNSYSMLSSAAGLFSGRFFGPGAEELAAVWNLYDGNAVASGVLVGGR